MRRLSPRFRLSGGVLGCLVAAGALVSCATPETAPVASPPAAVASASEAKRVTGQSARGAYWTVEAPANWNGVVLAYARGYSPRPSPDPETAPRGMRESLLAAGYGLAASSYASGGWSLETSPDDQLDAIAAFRREIGAPRRVIAWGDSMGGLTTVAIAERQGAGVDGAIALCGSVSGPLPMLNAALDGAFAFHTLAAPDSGIALVRIADDRANGELARKAIEAAAASPEGRARIALAGVLAQIPDWTVPGAPRPAAEDVEGRTDQIARALAMGVFLPRSDQEQRGGGVSSWNAGVDYAALLAASGRRDLVAAMYARAGLSLEADLAKLAAAPRITADAGAVAYMRSAWTPSGRLAIPLLSLHEAGDGMTIPALQSVLADTVAQAGRQDLLRQVLVEQAGHCRFTPAQRLAALRAMEMRLDTGAWSATAAELNRLAAEAGGEGLFSTRMPDPLARRCDPATGICPGEPASVR